VKTKKHLWEHESQSKSKLVPNLPIRKLSVFSLSFAVLVSSILGLIKAASADVYSVNISGTVLQYPFQRTGYLYVVPTITTYGTQNGINPYDVLLQVGDPGYYPQTGSIQFMSNNAFIGRAALDLAYVSWLSQYNTLRSQPDQRIAASGANIFNALTGSTATRYQIYSGYMDVQFLSNGNISGYVDLYGRGLTFSPNNRYTAWFNGYFLSRSLKREKAKSQDTPFSSYPNKRARIRIKPGNIPLPPPPDLDSKNKKCMKLR
jgi:hypothetical protein